MSLTEQMANIGSEVSRAANWRKRGNASREASSVDRALELMDLSIASATSVPRPDGAGKLAALKELTRCREVICDYFLGANDYNTNPEDLIKYFDQFAIALRSR